MSIIQVRNLSKEYKILKRKEGFLGALKNLFSKDYEIVKAVNNVSIDVEEGEIVGFIGPNGAGKSTTIKMLTGVLKPTSGTIKVNDFEPFKNRIKYVGTIGVVLGQRTQLWWDLAVIESYNLLKEMYNIDNKSFNENLDIYNELTGFKNLLRIPIRKLSLGQRTLCEILAAFLHNPNIIFLDEPTIGLDIYIKQQIRKVIKYLNKEKNTTILITSHDVGDIEALCNRIIVIDNGKIVYDSPAKDFYKIFGDYRTLKLDVSQIVNKEIIVSKLKKQFPVETNIDILLKDDSWMHLTIDQEKIKLLNVMKFVLGNFNIKDIQVEEIGLEQIVKKIYKRKIS